MGDPTCREVMRALYWLNTHGEIGPAYEAEWRKANQACKESNREVAAEARHVEDFLSFKQPFGNSFPRTDDHDEFCIRMESWDIPARHRKLLWANLTPVDKAIVYRTDIGVASALVVAYGLRRLLK